MSTFAEHEAEQAEITAMCEAGTCDHPECRKAKVDRAVALLKEAIRIATQWATRVPADTDTFTLGPLVVTATGAAQGYAITYTLDDQPCDYDTALGWFVARMRRGK